MTMFNVLLIVAGVLEYVLLGIDFKVSTISLLLPKQFRITLSEQLPEHIPWWNIDLGGFH